MRLALIKILESFQNQFKKQQKSQNENKNKMIELPKNLN